MGGGPYSSPETPKRSVSDKFVAWLNSIEFKDDNECKLALVEITTECNTRLQAMVEEGEAAIDKAEAEGS